MIDLYTWGTPNGTKVVMMLEECGTPYALNPVNLGKGEQRDEAFISLNPNGKIPVIVDRDGPDGKPFVLSESAAILLYLAEREGKFLTEDPAMRHIEMQWVMFQMSTMGPAFGQFHHFIGRSEPNDEYARSRFEREAHRILGLLDDQLANSIHVARDEFGIADMCIWPWLKSWCFAMKQPLAEYPNVQRYFDEVAKRPAVAKAAQLYETLRGS